MKIAGCEIDVGDLIYVPPRDGPTLWEIGIPDRSAAEFYIPDPNSMYINKLYVNHPDRSAIDLGKYFSTEYKINMLTVYIFGLLVCVLLLSSSDL